MDTINTPRAFDRRKPGSDRRDLQSLDFTTGEEKRGSGNERRRFARERREKMLAEITGEKSGVAVEARCLSAYQRHLLNTGIHDPESSLKIVHDFAIFLHNISKFILDVSEKDLENFLLLINNRHQSERITRKTASVLIDFYLLLIQEGVLVTNPLVYLYATLADDNFYGKSRGLGVDRFASVLAGKYQNGDSVEQKIVQKSEIDSGHPRGANFHAGVPPRYYNQEPDYPGAAPKRNFFNRRFFGIFGGIVAIGLIVATFPLWKKSLQTLSASLAQISPPGSHSSIQQVELPERTVRTSPQETKTKIYSVQRGNKIDRVTYFYQNNLADYYCQEFLNTLCNRQSLNLNPLRSDAKTMEDGSMVFSKHCARCHGINGRGDGPDAPQLETPPTRLVFVAERILEKDAYLFWAVAEGGIPFKTGMPAYKDILSTREIWSVILYLGML